MSTNDENIYSDLHKEAYGFRPGSYGMEAWSLSTPDEKQEKWDRVCVDLEKAFGEEQKREKEAIASFETSVKDNMDRGATDRKSVVRWILQSWNLEEPTDEYSAGYACWSLGLPSSYSHEFVM